MNFLKIDNICNIPIEYFKILKIKYVLVDLDNTLMGFESNTYIDEKIISWVKEVKENNIQVCILTNNNNLKRIKNASNILNVPYVLFALKPTLYGYKKAKKMLETQNNIKIPNEELVIIGDQVFTDYYMSRNAKISCILVDPISLKEDIIMKFIKRPIEKRLLKKIINKNN